MAGLSVLGPPPCGGIEQLAHEMWADRENHPRERVVGTFKRHELALFVDNCLPRVRCTLVNGNIVAGLAVKMAEMCARAVAGIIDPPRAVTLVYESTEPGLAMADTGDNIVASFLYYGKHEGKHTVGIYVDEVLEGNRIMTVTFREE